MLSVKIIAQFAFVGTAVYLGLHDLRLRGGFDLEYECQHMMTLGNTSMRFGNQGVGVGFQEYFKASKIYTEVVQKCPELDFALQAQRIIIFLQAEIFRSNSGMCTAHATMGELYHARHQHDKAVGEIDQAIQACERDQDKSKMDVLWGVREQYVSEGRFA